MSKKERVLLKLSGESLKIKGEKGVISDSVVSQLVKQIIEIAKNREVALVVGGGNIWRGDEHRFPALDNQDTHNIGMLATIMNSVAIQNYLTYNNVSSTILSAIPVPRVAHAISTQNLNHAFQRGDIVIFAGGTGAPFVTTDTCAAIRALEISADKILIGKNGVDGVYDKDPNVYSDAKFYEKVTYEEIIEKRLKVMDLSAMTVLMANKRPKLTVFNQDAENSFVRAIKGDIKTTEVY